MDKNTHTYRVVDKYQNQMIDRVLKRKQIKTYMSNAVFLFVGSAGSFKVKIGLEILPLLTRLHSQDQPRSPLKEGRQNQPRLLLSGE